MFIVISPGTAADYSFNYGNIVDPIFDFVDHLDVRTNIYCPSKNSTFPIHLNYITCQICNAQPPTKSRTIVGTIMHTYIPYPSNG